MENTMNDNYGTDNRNSQDEKRTNESGNSKLNDYRNEDDFADNNPESFYSNDKNSDPQKSDYTSEADLSNQEEEEEDEAEDIDDFDDIELDADRPDFQEVENEGVLEEDDELDELEEDELEEDELEEDELEEDELDEDEVYDPDAINNQDYLNSRTFI